MVAHPEFFFEEGRRVNVVALPAGPFQCESSVVELKRALEAKKLKLQMILSLGAENATLRTKENRFQAFVETLGQKKGNKDANSECTRPGVKCGDITD